MPLSTVLHSPMVGGPAEIHYRESGSGPPLVFLHGGWGYQVYPLDKQAGVVKDFCVVIPDRSGYGRSTKPAVFGPDLHRRAAEETLLFLDSIGIHKSIFWGHSDGAVIAAMIGLTAPQRCLGLVLEAFHYDREKLHSRAFFEAMASDPASFGSRVSGVLREEHGEPYWRDLLRAEGHTWLDIARIANGGPRDLFDGRLSSLQVPTVFIHGARDPRTEPWELDAVHSQLPDAPMHVLELGEHSPHSEAASAAEFGARLEEALARWSSQALRR